MKDASMKIETPEWVKHAVFYQIFPDRFNRSTRTQHVRGIRFKPWGSPPEEQGYQGGDLYGIVDRLDYLKDLGINALYLNPIFSAPSNHRYNAYDYMQVDPLLGGDAALRELLDEAHKREMRVVLDGVFNHCGRGFWAFHHILENGGDSPYLDWFSIRGFPLRAYPNNNEFSDSNYACWWGHPSLPKFNTDNPGVRDYLLQVARHWLEFGIDGWRLDVPEEIKDDGFWREFRRVVKGANPEAYIVGEIWHEARHWLQGDMFDAVMNYIITNHVLSFFGGRHLNLSWRHQDVNLRPIKAHEFATRLDAMHRLYDWEINYAQLNMLDSHDMPRALWLTGGDKPAFRLAVLCQMTMPGAPCVYYGDEIGMSSASDPHCREAFPWERSEHWDRELLAFYKSVIGLRNAYPALRTGDFKVIYAHEQAVAYRRSLDGKELIVVLNAGDASASVSIPPDELQTARYTPVWPQPGEVLTQVSGPGLHLQLPPQQAVVLVGEK
jgi:cyclomaltodextrinase